MSHHFNNDAERLAALKKMRRLIAVLIVLITITASALMYTMFLL